MHTVSGGFSSKGAVAGSPCEVPHRGGGDGWFGLQPVVQLLWLPKPPSAVPEFSESPPATSTRPAAMLRLCRLTPRMAGSIRHHGVLRILRESR